MTSVLLALSAVATPHSGCPDDYASLGRLRETDMVRFERVVRRAVEEESSCGPLLAAAGEHFAEHPVPELYPHLERMAQAHLNDEERGDVHDLLRALGATRDPRAYDFLAAQVLERTELHPFLRAGAAEGVGLSRDPRARQRLLTMLRVMDPASYGALAGLEWVGLAEDAADVTPLLDDPALIWDATKRLATLGNPAATEPLLRHLRTPGPWNREEVVRTLVQLGGPRVPEVLRYLACVEESSSIRADARAQLAQHNQSVHCEHRGGLRARLMNLILAEDEDQNDSTVDAARAPDMDRGLTSTEPAVRFAAASDLAALHLPAEVSALRSALSREGVDWVKPELTRALEQSLTGSEGFRRRLLSPDVQVRRRATSELRSTRFPERETLLLQQMGDEDAHVVRISVAAVDEDKLSLAFLRSPELEKVLLRQQQGQTDERALEYIRRALSKIAGTRAG